MAESKSSRAKRAIPLSLGEILTIKELAAFLKIPRTTLYLVVRQGGIPHQRIGRHIRFHRDTIARWIRSGSS